MDDKEWLGDRYLVWNETIESGWISIPAYEWDEQVRQPNIPKTTEEMQEIIAEHAEEERKYKLFRKAHDEGMQQESAAESYDRAMGIIE